MPTDKSGKFHMNPQHAKAADAAAAPLSHPQADPAAPDSAAQTFTITEVPGQGFTVTGPDGQAQPAASLEDALAAVQAGFGEPDADDQGIAPDADIAGVAV